MLQNRIYRGEIVHKDQGYPGEHQPIIDQALWDEVRVRLAANRVERRAGVKAAEPSLLARLVHDDVGTRMTPTHANKKGTRYRYYVSQSLIKPGRAKDGDGGRRVPAGDLERLVEDRIVAFLRDPAAIFSSTKLFILDVNQRKAVIRRGRRAGQRMERDRAVPAKATA